MIQTSLEIVGRNIAGQETAANELNKEVKQEGP